MTAFRMGIAGTALEASGPKEWITPLIQAWSTWSPAPGIESWKVSLLANNALPVPTAPLFDARMRCQKGVCLLEAPGFYGRIDARAGAANLVAHPKAQSNDIDYFLRVALAVQAFARGGVLFHAAGIVHLTKGYALFGLSGSGKTTAAKLSAPDPVLNDDLLLLWPENEQWMMHATPFGKGRGNMRVAQVRAFLRLRKDVNASLQPLKQSRALSELVANTPVLSGDVVWLPKVLTRWEKIMATIPVAALHFQQDSTFWEVIDAQLG